MTAFWRGFLAGALWTCGILASGGVAGYFFWKIVKEF